MGRSTTQQLITKGQNENGYNNSGIDTPAKWVDFFNDALADLVDDIGLTEHLTINFVAGTREYDLPEDFFSLDSLNDASNCPVRKRRSYDQRYPSGYWIIDQGDVFVIDLHEFTSAQTFTGEYVRYPAVLTVGAIQTEKPQVPTVDEKALIYYAIAKALRNNNQIGQAQDYEALYEAERKKIRNAAAQARR